MTDKAQDSELRWTRRIERERSARKQAEVLLEKKSLELYLANQELAASHADLEVRIAARTSELAEAVEEAKDASAAKSMFLASMSHEIRTPLNGVLGMNRLLLETELCEDQRSMAGTLQTSAEALMVLLNDILDISKFQAGQLELEHIGFEVRRLAEETCELSVEKAQVGGVELLLSIDPKVPIRLTGDPGRLRQVILNLLSNAAKFTKEGEIELRIQLADEPTVKPEQSDPTCPLIRFEVRDTGIGIPANAISGLFNSFSQVDASTTRKYGGTGLGLSICKQLAEYMGGAIGVESLEGQGSAFWFTARLEQTAPPVPAPTATHTALLLSKQVRLQEIMREELSSQGFEMQVASLASEAASALCPGTSITHILLDAAMYTDTPGLADTLAPAVDSSNASFAILCPVGRGPYPELECLTPTLIKKPARRSVLASFLNIEQASSGKKPAPHGLDQYKISLADGTRPLVLLVEDNRVNQIVARGTLNRLGVDIEIAENGIEALAAIDPARHCVVLMDCQMPEMDGYQAASMWRQQEQDRGGHIPILAMTANAMPGDRQRCLDAGMDDYISKPFTPEDLASLLAIYCAPFNRKAG
jgi:two-component system sensor histidine kinase/response regulator